MMVFAPFLYQFSCNSMQNTVCISQTMLQTQESIIQDLRKRSEVDSIQKPHTISRLQYQLLKEAQQP